MQDQNEGLLLIEDSPEKDVVLEQDVDVALLLYYAFDGVLAYFNLYPLQILVMLEHHV